MPNFSDLPRDMLIETLGRMDATSLLRLTYATGFFPDEKRDIKAMAKSNQLWKKHLADRGFIDPGYDFSNWPETSLYRAYVRINTLLFNLEQARTFTSDLFLMDFSKTTIGLLSPAELALFADDEKLFDCIIEDPRAYKNPFKINVAAPKLLAIAGYMGTFNLEGFLSKIPDLDYNDKDFFHSNPNCLIYPGMSAHPQSKNFIFSLSEKFNREGSNKIYLPFLVHYVACINGNTEGLNEFLARHVNKELANGAVIELIKLAISTANKEILNQLFQLPIDISKDLFPSEDKAQLYLLDAAKSGEPEVLIQLLKKCPWPMDKLFDEHNHGLLYVACLSGKMDMIHHVIRERYGDSNDLLQQAVVTSNHEALQNVTRSGSLQAFQWIQSFYSAPNQLQEALKESNSLFNAACSGNTILFQSIADKIGPQAIDGNILKALASEGLSEIIEESKSPAMLKRVIDFLIDAGDVSEMSEHRLDRAVQQERIIGLSQENLLVSAIKTGRVELFEMILNMYLSNEDQQQKLGDCFDLLEEQKIPESFFFLMFKRCDRKNKETLFNLIQNTTDYENNPLNQAKLFYLLAKLDISFVAKMLQQHEIFAQAVRQGLNESYQPLLDDIMALTNLDQEPIPKWEDLEREALQRPRSLDQQQQ